MARRNGTPRPPTDPSAIRRDETMTGRATLCGHPRGITLSGAYVGSNNNDLPSHPGAEIFDDRVNLLHSEFGEARESADTAHAFDPCVFAGLGKERRGVAGALGGG